MPHFWFNHVDVRDVAKAHLLAMTKEEAAGERFLLAHPDSDWLMRNVKLMSEHMAPQYSVGTWPLPYAALWLASWFDGGVAMVLPGWGKKTYLNPQKSIDVLGLQYTSVRDTYAHSCDSFVAHGEVEVKEGFEPEWKVPSA